MFPPEEGLKRPARFEKQVAQPKSQVQKEATYSDQDNKVFSRLKDFEQVQAFEGLVDIR